MTERSMKPKSSESVAGVDELWLLHDLTQHCHKFPWMWSLQILSWTHYYTWHSVWLGGLVTDPSLHVALTSHHSLACCSGSKGPVVRTPGHLDTWTSPAETLHYGT